MDWATSNIFWIAAASVVFIISIFAMGLFSGNQMPVDGKTVLITGGSEGMGLSAATQLSAKGANIVIVSRNPTKLEAALTQIEAAAKNHGTQRFYSIAADVSVPSYAESVIAETMRWNNGQAPDIVWCIAGMSTPALFVDMEMDSLRRQMDINFYGTAEMSHTILKEWLKADAPVSKQPKHLIMTTSVVALYTIPGYAPYAPSKWAIRGLADTLSQEVMMYPQQVKVHLVCPGSILSPGYENENLTKPEVTKILESSDPKQTPEDVASSSIKGLENGDYYVTVNYLGNLMKWGALGGAFRNSWIVDILGAWLVSLLWIFIQPDLHSKIRNYGKKNGHPSTYKKN